MWRKVFNLYESQKNSQIYLRWWFAQCHVWYFFKISQRFFEMVIFHNRKNSARCSPHSHRLFRATGRWGSGAPTAWVLAQGGGLWGAARWRDCALADTGPMLAKYHSPAFYQVPAFYQDPPRPDRPHLGFELMGDNWRILYFAHGGLGFIHILSRRETPYFGVVGVSGRKPSTIHLMVWKQAVPVRGIGAAAQLQKAEHHAVWLPPHIVEVFPWSARLAINLAAILDNPIWWWAKVLSEV